MQAKEYEFRVFEDGSSRLRAKVVGLNAEPLIPDDVDSIAWSLWNRNKKSEEVSSGTLAVGSVFQEPDSENWNFVWDAPASLFPEPRPYSLAIRFELVDESVVWLKLKPDALRTSAG